MNLPTLPTDNLYKFMALAGIVLMLFSVVYPFQRLQELEIRAIDSRTQLAIVGQRVALLQFQVKAMEKDPAATDEKILALRSKSTDLGIEALRGVGENKKNEALLSQLRLFAGISLFTSLGGLVLAIAGFLLWYLRIQKPSDRQAHSA
ncbi:hypothetical protein [Frateuria sp.]|uniref:hypothetical protein n=1 Tax=Frateuria sp. TaxID=2211372 RepID=UPI003F81A0BF